MYGARAAIRIILIGLTLVLSSVPFPSRITGAQESDEEGQITDGEASERIRLSLDDSFNVEELTGGVFVSDDGCPGGWPVKAGIDASGQSVYYPQAVARL